MAKARANKLGIYEAANPLRLLPFELRILSRGQGPDRWLVDLSSSSDRLIAPQDYDTVALPEDPVVHPRRVRAAVGGQGLEAPLTGRRGAARRGDRARPGGPAGASRAPPAASPVSCFGPFGGAHQDVGPDDTAFGGSRSGYGVYAIGLTKTNEELPAERDWVRSFCQALQPHARGIGSYVNSMTEFEDDRVRASYGPQKYARLAESKRRYDPDNLFHLTPNIKPAYEPRDEGFSGRQAPAKVSRVPGGAG
ncbi:BBE domain-containing protein [Pseudonocardia sp. RS11V-5]|uniref:BBE domain-containing protein n=1 Tax=Pseudonocardia terrae TaxID=2905831 RepID=UPI001E5F7A96|nr:BBE domain-containing protein [Pseudonocardia terrae]MCE3552898.1 BBE domain-containing protein [Pseudonocardia terrae]